MDDDVDFRVLAFDVEEILGNAIVASIALVSAQRGVFGVNAGTREFGWAAAIYVAFHVVYSRNV